MSSDASGQGQLKVLFYEPAHTGHHFAYLARMLPGFLRLPVQPVLATTQVGVESKEFQLTLAPLAGELEVLTCCRPGSSLSYKMGLRQLRELRRIVRQERPDHVCILYAHGIWQLWAASLALGMRLAPRETTVEMWEYRGGFSYLDARGVNPSLKRRLLAKLLRSGHLSVMHSNDEVLFEFAAGISGSKTQVKLAPDPIKLHDMVDKRDARLALSIAPAGRWVSCSGMIDKRKGCDLAVRAFAAHLAKQGDRASGDHLLLAGPHAEEIHSLLEEPHFKPLVEQGRIVSLNRFLDEEEMYLSAAASDLVLATYPNHSGRSSIILWAAAAGRPVLGVDRGCIQYVVEQERLGATCDVKDIDQLSIALTTALDQDWTDTDIQRVRTYAAWHRVENYQDLSSQFVRERCEHAGE